MARIYLFAPPQPVEVVRVLDGELENCEVEKFPVFLFGGEEYVYSHCDYRKVRFREDGRRYILVCLENEKLCSPGTIMRRILDDGECYAQ